MRRLFRRDRGLRCFRCVRHRHGFRHRLCLRRRHFLAGGRLQPQGGQIRVFGRRRRGGRLGTGRQRRAVGFDIDRAERRTGGGGRRVAGRLGCLWKARLFGWCQRTGGKGEVFAAPGDRLRPVEDGGGGRRVGHIVERAEVDLDGRLFDLAGAEFRPALADRHGGDARTGQRRAIAPGGECGLRRIAVDLGPARRSLAVERFGRGEIARHAEAAIVEIGERGLRRIIALFRGAPIPPGRRRIVAHHPVAALV